MSGYLPTELGMTWNFGGGCCNRATVVSLRPMISQRSSLKKDEAMRAGTVTVAWTAAEGVVAEVVGPLGVAEVLALVPADVMVALTPPPTEPVVVVEPAAVPTLVAVFRVL